MLYHLWNGGKLPDVFAEAFVHEIQYCFYPNTLYNTQSHHFFPLALPVTSRCNNIGRDHGRANTPQGGITKRTSPTKNIYGILSKGTFETKEFE
jgi:hypothetical protein